MTYDYIKQKKILLVDDEESLCQMVCSIFQKENYTRLRTAGTMTEALAICKEWKPDFAVLDVMLPDGDGISLLEKMRKFTEIPVLFLTALGEDEDRLKGLLAGADKALSGEAIFCHRSFFFVLQPFFAEPIRRRRLWLNLREARLTFPEQR